MGQRDSDGGKRGEPGAVFWRGAALVVGALLLAALGLIALEFFGLTRGSHTTATGASSPQTTIDPTRDGIACLRDAEWSPDGEQIAIVGDSGACATTGHAASVTLNRYDARTGTLIQAIPLTQLLAGTALNLPAQTPAVVTNLLWSADGKRLAVAYVLLGAATAQSQSIAAQGVVMLNADGTQPRALLQPYASGDEPGEWDVASGTFLPVTGASAAGILPPASAYAWGAAGALQPQSLASATPPAAVATPPGPVGEPVGGATFTLWQPGTLEYLVQGQRGTSVAAQGVFVWVTSMGAWSPDGRYILPYGQLGGRIQPPGAAAPDPTLLADLGLSAVGILPTRDAALAAVAKALAGSGQDANTLITLAWRPDGALLATYGQQQGGTLDLFSAASGARVGQLATVAGPTALTGAPRVLRWSPDGTRLLLITSDMGEANIWTINARP